MCIRDSAEGELIIMPANVPHAVYATTRFKMELVMIHELESPAWR